MAMIDLTHTLTPDTPVFPGDPPPAFTRLTTVDTDGYASTQIALHSHSGTHMDAPSHIRADGRTLDCVPVDTFVGTAAVVSCLETHHRTITMAHLAPHLDRYAAVDFLLFHTGWDRYWGDAAYFSDYPLLDDEVITFLLNHVSKGIGFDTLSLDDPFDQPNRRHQRIFRAKPLLILENLRGLDECPEDPFTLIALPLKYANADGAPTRVIALTGPMLARHTC